MLELSSFNHSSITIIITTVLLNPYKCMFVNNVAFHSPHCTNPILLGFPDIVPQGKSTFLTGFGLGFLAFGLKKLLLPIFLGAQLVKSVLIAMFLPSILGSIGKIIGKGEPFKPKQKSFPLKKVDLKNIFDLILGLSQFSGSSINLAPPVQMEDVDYKDNMGYPSEQEASYTYPNSDTLGTINANALYGGNTATSEDLANIAMSRFLK